VNAPDGIIDVVLESHWLAPPVITALSSSDVQEANKVNGAEMLTA
jgi:hypothetical protein